MTETASTALTVAKPPSKKGTGFGVALFILFLLIGMLAGLCAYRWLVFLPESHVQRLDAQAEQIDLLDQRIGKLETAAPAFVAAPAPPNPSTAASADDMARMQTEVSSLSAALASLQGAVRQIGDTKDMVGTAVAYIRLDRAARSGHGFQRELASFRASCAHMPDILAAAGGLDGYAVKGAPSLANLQSQWSDLAPQAASAIDKSNAQNWRDRLLAELRVLVTIRSVKDKQPDDTLAVSKALAQDDLSAALNAVQKLPAEAQNIAADWRQQLEDRQKIDEALDSLAGLIENQPVAASGAQQ